ncbi:MAG: hypothetical protein JSU03_12720 [Bacteroidetes bacterium]|nr:hypothetical protein [Bacteroidota bacterium]MBS1758129.1 hypothetical protein [Bacteroidota bacterium]
MKKIAVLSFAFAAISFCASAQQVKESGSMAQHKHHHHSHHLQKMKMLKSLNFSDAQKAQLKANRQEYKQKMHTLNQEENITVKEQRDRKAALRQEQKNKFQALLTSDQKTKLAEEKTQLQAQRKARSAKKLEALKTKISLTDEQVSKIQAQQEATHLQIQALKQNQSLSREEKMAKLKSILKDSKAERKSIYTPDQLKKLEDLKKERGEMQKTK